MRTPVRHYLRQWRIHRNFTQAEVAEKIARKHSTISLLESGAYGYDQYLLEALAELYRITPAELLSTNPLRTRQRIKRQRRRPSNN